MTTGDPAGIGPEIVRAAFADARVAEQVSLVGLGSAPLRPPGVVVLDSVAALAAAATPRHVWLDTPGPARWDMGRVQAECGAAALEALRIGHELALTGRVDALVTAPVNKAALHAAGERVEGQTELLSRWAGVERTGMLAVADQLRVLLLTRHMPLAEALGCIATERVVDHLQLLDEALRALGFERPRLALAGLNPHAGEGGLLGGEEQALLEPAAAVARDLGLDVHGPVSPDSVFLAAREGRYDGVLALYHDQAFIPLKLVSQGRGLTVIAGLPYLRVSPVHGTAFDIAGQGRASAENLVHALLQTARWCEQRRQPR